MPGYFERSLILHEQLRGKLGIQAKVPVSTRDDLSIAYTPGVARPCEAIVRTVKYLAAGFGGINLEDIARMADNAIVLAMANPVPEILPDDAKAGGATVVGTGRSDFPNQVNNLLAFPGIFRGALDACAAQITPAMKLAAAHALADCVESPSADAILPDPLDQSVAPRVAAAVAAAWPA